MVNGELTTLPDHFQWKWRRSIINKTIVPPKINFLDPLKISFFSLTLQPGLDIFYLSKANFCQLTEDYYIDESKRYQTTSGWLNQKTNRRKLIVPTESLNKDQERELFHHIERAKLSKIGYLDLTQVPENKVSSPGISGLRRSYP